MNENKYHFKGTQGEWRFVQTQMIGRSMNECDFNIAVYDKNKGRYDHFVNCWKERFNIGFNTSKAQAEANAHLIAAAPELLQACVDALERMQMNGRFPELQGILVSAIHKALNIQD